MGSVTQVLSDYAPSSPKEKAQKLDHAENDRLLKLRRLPARLHAEDVAVLLGCSRHDIPILAKAKLLTPLGCPASNGPKMYATSTIERKSKNTKFLHDATKAIVDHWKSMNDAKRKKKLLPN